MADIKTVIPQEQVDKITRIIDDMHIAKNIVTKCQKTLTVRNKNNALQYYTDIQHLEGINDLFKKKTKTYLQWLQDLNVDKGNLGNVTYEQLRKAIYTEYVDKLKIPTRQSLVTNLNFETTVNISTATLDHLTTYHGFTWKRLGKTNKYTIIEKTEQAARKMRYLYEMRQIREANRVIVYVELRTITISVDTIDMRRYRYENIKEVIEVDTAVAVSPQIGLIGAVVYKGGNSSMNIDTWLNNSIGGLPEDTVFVIEAFPELLNDLNVPTKHSQKNLMKKWLKKNNIPFAQEYHRGGLFALIEMYKSRHQVKIESLKLLIAKNYKVIFRPQVLSFKRYFNFLWSKLDDVETTNLVELKAEYMRIIKDIENEEWYNSESEMADFEMSMLEEDERLELVIDKLMESAQNNSLNMSDLEDCEEYLIDDEYIDSILAK